ncbi:hypothetical protein [Amycolatopsis rifamycinica]|uniref:Uncharacterized protein n=1 Tax=Amycolatopsis rifamycinica TaxID=287986 RepID=A0A066UGU2_9PSEU|nr:hypothetical protein [Amycolatopsis rifamycinica]KDN23443.1 hypothetical protein DV20_04535 [Amycolatopsis rifamycinica]
MNLEQLRRAGVSDRRTRRLCGPGGPWRRLHPGVVLLRNTAPTRQQLLHAAVVHYGPGVVITGADALQAHGVKCPAEGDVSLLVPQHCRVVASEGARLARTARLPDPVEVDGLPFAPPARATLDLARSEPDPARVRQVLTMPLYWGLCDRQELLTELEEGSQRGTAVVRKVLRELDEGPIQAHGLAARVLDLVPLPPPSWDQTICDRRGRRLGEADAWWDELGLAWQYRCTPGPGGGFSHLALAATGIVLVRCTAGQLRQAPREVAQELARAYGEASRTPRPKVRAVPQTPIGDAA